MHLVRRFVLVLLHPPFDHGKYYRADEKAAAELFVENEALRLAGAVVVDVDLSMSVDMSSEDEDDFTSELLGLTRKASDQGHEAREKTKPTMLENPLKWWKSNAGDFPLLSPVVIKYFGVAATSVPSERCFSSAGNAITSRRNKLTGDNVRDIIFLHNNQASDTEEDESDASSS
ncbi:hypothetical protein ON010_g668 [Phytophthora cinnamomi]|nr:hypothetical protein ON010_g668 [Phytophthora cinnamomi]